MDIKEFFNAIPQLWYYIGAGFGTFIIVMIGIAVSFFSGTKAVYYWNEFKAEWKMHRAQLRTAVDEPTDALPVALSALFKGRFTPQQFVDLLTGAIDVSDLLDEPDKSALQDAVHSLVK